MKKILVYSLLTALLGGVATLVSCSKSDTTPTAATGFSATINGSKF